MRVCWPAVCAAVLLFAAGASLGCTFNPGGLGFEDGGFEPDAAVVDARNMDASYLDGDPVDAQADALAPDAPPADAYPPDAQPDAQPADASPADAEPADASPADAEPEVDSDTGTPVVTGCWLINADTDTVIGPFGDGDTIDLSELPTANLNVRADTAPAVVGSVRFGLDGDPNYRTEDSQPYALAGDVAGDYHPWTPSTGGHTLTATPYSQAGAGGEAGTAMIIDFTVVP